MTTSHPVYLHLLYMLYILLVEPSMLKKEIFTKWCVFLTLRLLFYFPSKDRLPFYERIYRNVVSSQPERYERQHPLSPTTGMPVTEGTSWGKHELGMFHDLILISRGQEPKRPVSEGQGLYYMYYKMEICIMQDYKIFWKHEISVDCIVTMVVFLSLSWVFLNPVCKYPVCISGFGWSWGMCFDFDVMWLYFRVWAVLSST